MQKKREVCLYALEQLGLIIKANSGVVYYNQAGGYSCLQPSEEGILTIIDDDTKVLLTRLSELTLNKTELTYEDANLIDGIFKSSHEGKFLSIDRNKLKSSMEAWINVIIDYEELSDNTSLKGFTDCEGVLTWNNSD